MSSNSRETVFRYRINAWYWVIAMPLACGLIWLGAQLVSAGKKSTTIADQVLPVIFGSFLVLSAFVLLAYGYMLYAGAIYVACDDRGIRVKNAVRLIAVNWTEILEFGTYKAAWGANPEVNRIFYLIASNYGERRVKVCNSSLAHIDELIELVFENAVNAR